ncbi:MAG: 4-alpha-glucanotransferase [Gammaproteobacteria bacterium]
MVEDWRAAAFAAGLEPDYWDGLGMHRVLGEDTARALLAALATSDGDGGAAVLPAAACVTVGEPLALACRLPATAAGAVVAWEVVEEGGACHAGTTTAIATGDAAGADTVTCRLETGLVLPPGYHQLHLPAHGTRCCVIAAPARAWLPDTLARGARRWGLAVQVYSLGSASNWGMGDFTDLARVVASAARAGAALVGVNPLHARHLAEPHEASPYAPASRYALDPLYLDVTAVPDVQASPLARALMAEAEFQSRLAAARAEPLVDHAAIAALKLPVLRAGFECFRVAASPARRAAFEAFRAAAHWLEDFATGEALRLACHVNGRSTDWRRWPAAWRDPRGAEVAAWRCEHAAEVEFVAWLQWQADEQLAAVAAVARAGGMEIGLYRDVAVGASPVGSECWAAGGLVAHGASVGAPPDLLNHNGQDWGLPPWNPRELAERAYRPFAELLAANMRHAGALRIDHVMALRRLFWIPAGRRGEDGAYLRQPFDCLAAVLALESVRQHCLVVGEDLGSVPEGLREALAARGVLSYRVLLFERHWDGDGSFKRPHEYPAQALATVVTHDMPTVAELWSGADIARREALALYPDADFGDAERGRREAERAGLLALAAELGLGDPGNDAAAVTGLLHELVARSAAMLAVVQLDDVSGEDTPVNVPGTYDEYPNWRRKLGVTVEALEDLPAWRQLVATMTGAGRNRGRGAPGD